MKIIAVCGMGIGTSVLLKMNIDQALETLGIDGEVEAADISSARGAAASADLVMTSSELVEQLGDVDTPIIVVDNFVDQDEVKEKLEQGLNL
ncbi:MAG: PTS sugar transporter subunit IIB [Gulosibacter sp.]|uniref:PTS sugar transporter subunit IIB n=1 Tax=Gulosibacter sp. TaxID=2817531 RepID=UPI003F911C7F